MQELQDMIQRYETAIDKLRRLIPFSDDWCVPTFLTDLNRRLAILETLYRRRESALLN